MSSETENEDRSLSTVFVSSGRCSSVVERVTTGSMIHTTTAVNLSVDLFNIGGIYAVYVYFIRKFRER